MTDFSARTLEYGIYRVCERWHKWPGEFKGLPEDERLKLIAYEEIRIEEDKEVQKRETQKANEDRVTWALSQRR